MDLLSKELILHKLPYIKDIPGCMDFYTKRGLLRCRLLLGRQDHQAIRLACPPLPSGDCLLFMMEGALKQRGERLGGKVIWALRGE